METQILIENLKCGGCATSIKLNLKKINGIIDAQVNHDKDEVTITHTTESELIEAKNKLHQMGYPEKGTTQGLDKIITGAKSYISCAIGKITENNIKSDESHVSR